MVLRMDFLQSSKTDPQQVVLLLIVANQGMSRLLLYKWDSWQPLTTTKPLRCSGYALPSEDAFPHLLIPSRKALSFAIVTGHKLVFYDDITTKKKTKLIFNIPTPENQKDKQWVQWAKAARHQLHEESKEDIFLIREDGLLKTTVVTHNSRERSHISFEPGHLHIRVDTAVCALSAPPLIGGDILIACGDTTEGGVFHLQATELPVNRQVLANWSPITDLVLLDERSKPSLPGDHARILAATGIHDNRAFLTEIRYGVEAQIAQDTDCEDAATVDRLWILHQPSHRRDIFLTSHHEYTNIVCFEEGDERPIARGPETFPELGFDDPTLAACNLDRDSILQITTSQIHVLDPSEYRRIDPESLRGNFVCAGANPASGSFVVASRDEQAIQLIGGVALARSDNSIDVLPLHQSVPIDYLPISLTIANIAGTEIFIAGSQDGFLHLYCLTAESGITGSKKWDLSSFHQGLDEPKISSVEIFSLPSARNGLVLCGLKTGQIIIFEMTMQNLEDPESIDLSLSRFETIGSTSVSISVETGTFGSDEKSAYVVCGTALFQIHLYRNSWGLDFTMDSLLITVVHQNKKHLQRSMFNAVAPIERASSMTHGHMYGSLAGITQNDLLLLRIGRSTLIPERVSQIKPTHHLVYSAHLKKVIASVPSRKPSSPEDSLQSLEARPSLQILDPPVPAFTHEHSNAVSYLYFGQAGEKVRTLLQWSPTNGQTHYEMIVIGSDYDGDGRLSYITAKRLSQGKPGSSATTFVTYSKKLISAVCEYGLSSLLVCAGRELKLVHLDLSTKPPRWEHQAEIELPSRATELRTKGSVVYVATSLHSYMLIREQDKKFHVIGSDNWAGRARNVLPYGNGSTLVNLISDEGSRVLNFADRPVRGNKPTFEATVPEAIDKIVNLKSMTGDDIHERFLAATIDGTVYMFTTLNEREMRLLAFLEQLCQPIRDQAAKSASLLAQRIVHQYANKLESAGITTPSSYCTHARGDVLRGLLMPGPYNIHFLLRQRVKKEEDDDSMIKEEDELESLRDVARPVLGQTDDLVEGVILWLRRMLSVPSL